MTSTKLALRTSLGPISGCGMMLNNVLGAGILSIPGLAAHMAGAESFWTWVIASIIALPLLGVFAVFAVTSPHAGGVIAIAGQSFGNLGAFLTAALLFSAVILGVPSIALTGGYYLEGAFGLPAWMGACGLLVAATGVNLVSAHGASKIGTIVSVGVIFFIIILLACGLYGIGLSPALIPVKPDMTALSPFALVFFSFAGWEISLGLSEEFANPGRDIPLAIFSSWLLATIFYALCALTVIALGASFWTAHPFLDILTTMTGNRAVATTFVACGATCLIWANLFAAIWGLSRMALRSTSWRLLQMERRNIPVMAVLFTGGAMTSVVLISALFSINISRLLASAGMNFLVIYAIAAAALVLASRHAAVRGLAVLSLALVVAAGLVLGHDLTYPLIVIAGALALFFCRPNRQIDPR